MEDFIALCLSIKGSTKKNEVVPHSGTSDDSDILRNLHIFCCRSTQSQHSRLSMIDYEPESQVQWCGTLARALSIQIMLNLGARILIPVGSFG